MLCPKIEYNKNTISINFDNLDDILVNISSDDDNEPIEEILNNKELFEKYGFKLLNVFAQEQL